MCRVNQRGNTMKIVLKCGKFIFALFISLCILNVITFVYRNTSLHLYNDTGATDYKALPNFVSGNLQEGFAFVRMDEDGFNNQSVMDKIDILLMGSSHMEALQVSQSENVGFLLNEISEYRVYNIGVSGHTLYRCVDNYHNAVAHYHPQKYVIIETDRINLNPDEMRSVIHKEPVNPDTNTGMEYYLIKYIPVTKLLHIQMTEWRKEKGFFQTQETPTVFSSDYVQLLDSFLKVLSNEGECEAKLMIVYHPESVIGEDAELQYTDGNNLKIFQKACEKNDILFVNMADDFDQLYHEKHVLAHGFINTAVGTGHLNKYGHQIIAERIVKVIKEDQK